LIHLLALLPKNKSILTTNNKSNYQIVIISIIIIISIILDIFDFCLTNQFFGVNPLSTGHFTGQMPFREC